MARRFTPVGLLGTGGQGRVFAVRDAARGDAVLALKERTVGATGELREEFELLCRLRHPHIAAVHDWLCVSPIATSDGETPPGAYTQDLVAGTDLFTALRDATSEQQIAAFEQVFRALAYLHAVEVVHLDLKPDNVLVDLDGATVTARVLDFGVAERQGTMTDLVIGSPSYVAPERLRGDPVSPQADLYAVGVMMAEVSSRQPLSLYKQPGLADTAARRDHMRAIGVSEDWLETVVALTAFDPAERPGSVYEAAARFGHGIHRTVALHTPATVAAILRAGAPVGHETTAPELGASVAGGGAHVLVGASGTGRRTLARQVARRLQLAGHDMELWPGSPESLSTAGFARALERLLGHDAGLGRVGVERSEPGQRTHGIDAKSIEQRLRASVSEVTRRLLDMAQGGSRPLLVVEVFEDAPWPVRMLVEALVEAHEEGAVLPLGLLVVADEHVGAAATSILPLTTDDVGQLLDQRLGAGLSTRALAGALTGASGGNPAALESLLTLMTQRGELRFGPEGWSGAEDGKIAPLPEAFGAAVKARLELLTDDQRELVSAVSWMRFPSAIAGIAAALDRSGAPAPAQGKGGKGAKQSVLAAELEELEAIGLVRAQGGGSWVPSHEDVHDAVHGWAPPGGVDAAHRRVLDVAAPEGLAFAWHQGGEAGAEGAREVGEAAWASGAMREAEEAFSLADELQPQDALTLARRADVADLLGPREVQIRCLEQIIDLEPRDSVEGLRARARLLWSLTRTADVERAAVVGAEVIALAESLGDEGVQTAALVDLANVANQRGEYDEGERLLREARERTDPMKDPGGAARIANNLGNILAYRGENEAALESYSEALRLKTLEGDPVGCRIAVGNMGLMCGRLHRSEEALHHFASSMRAARTLGHRRGEAWCLLAISELGHRAGALSFAARRARGAWTLAEKLGDRVIACDARSTLAEIVMESGQTAEAIAHAEAGLEEALAVDSSYNASAARSVLAQLIAAEDPRRARDLAEAVVAEESTHPTYRAAARRVLAELDVAGGELDSAWAHVSGAIDDVGKDIDERLLSLALRVAGLRGDDAATDALIERATTVLAAREHAWPLTPCDDEVDEGARLDGPSRKTWRARAAVQALLAQVGTPASDLARRRTEAVDVMTRAIRDDVGDITWCDLLIEGGGGIAAAMAWLIDVVREHGAERGFLLGPDAVVLASCDADGDPVADADRKVPLEAVEEAKRAGGRWRGEAGQGALWGAVEEPPSGVPVAVVLQNRFSREAFSALEATPDRGRLRLLSHVLGLRKRAEEVTRRFEDAESTRRADTAQSTEHLLRLRRALEVTREQLGPERHFSEIIYDSSAMRRMLRRVERVIETDLPVWVWGESGTGKELVARALHRHGARAEGPFVAQNCGAIPAPLFESEFFGHVRGAFTGAHRDQEGLFRRADGGTLFLDEVGDLPMDQQAKLLRVLETGDIQPVGSSETHHVDVRIVCATHRDLSESVAEGTFREDLYYRLNVVRINIPPLRERPDDVPVLVEHFLASCSGPEGAPVGLASGVMRAWISYPWPGNVRELENEVTRAALLCDGTIRLGDLSEAVRSGGPSLAGSNARGDLAGLGLTKGTLKQRVDRLEYIVLKDALVQSDNNKSHVARELGLSRAGLNMKLKRLGLWDGG